ncbi:MAG TPA: hypothetical protein DCG16_03690 [Gemmatimonadetes bacterium]|nr:hypothetical protein [Gemmatimonadota bacterium]
MSDDYPIRPANMDAAREQAVEVLTEHFSRNVMDMDEFEGLLDSVNRCSTTSELRELLSKLPPLESLKSATDLMSAPGGPPVVVDADRVRPRGFLLSVLSGTTRAGRWIPARKSFALGVLGGISLDFREAVLGAGVTDVNVLAVLGSVEIIVPPEMAVEVDGMAVLGGFEYQTNAPPRTDPNLPILRVRGLAVLAGVNVEVRLPGETSRDAKKRRRLERTGARRRTQVLEEPNESDGRQLWCLWAH